MKPAFRNSTETARHPRRELREKSIRNLAGSLGEAPLRLHGGRPFLLAIMAEAGPSREFRLAGRVDGSEAIPPQRVSVGMHSGESAFADLKID